MGKQIKLVGIKPYFHQQSVINELINAAGTGKIVCVNSSRQKGKSYLVSNILLFYAINYPKTKSFYLAPTLKQGKVLYKNIVNAISESKIIKSKNATELVINLINGSSIYFKSAEQREALRGETCSGILALDEAAYISDDIFYTVLPWCDAKKAPILMTSTPFVKSGFFFQYFNYGLLKENNTVTIDWSEEKYQDSIEQILPKSKLEEYKRILPKNVFLTDYLGKFLDGEGSVFNEFKDCIKFNKIENSDRLYFGIDWAAGTENDDTAVVAFNQKGEQVYLNYFNNKSSNSQIRIIGDVLELYRNQIVVVQTELNSLGTPLTDFLKQRSHINTLNYVGFNTTNQSKNALVTNLQLAFEKKEISILGDEKQISELGYYSAEFNPKTRNVSYNAPQGLHDDIVIALMLAYDAYKNTISTGNYSLTFPSNRKKHKPIKEYNRS